MKVIARTGSGYLVETTADELAQAAGYRAAFYADGRLPGFNLDHYQLLPIGTVVLPAKAQAYLEALRNQEKKCKDSAAFLRGMADMLDAAMPTTIVPPDEPEPKQ